MVIAFRFPICGKCASAILIENDSTLYLNRLKKALAIIALETGREEPASVAFIALGQPSIRQLWDIVNSNDVTNKQLVGCKEDSRITNYEQAKCYCPLIHEKKEKEKSC